MVSQSCTNRTYGYRIRIQNTVSNTCTFCMLIISHCYYMHNISRCVLHLAPTSIHIQLVLYMKTTMFSQSDNWLLSETFFVFFFEVYIPYFLPAFFLAFFFYIYYFAWICNIKMIICQIDYTFLIVTWILFSIISNDSKKQMIYDFQQVLRCFVYQSCHSTEKHHEGKPIGVPFTRMDSLFKSIAMLLFKLTTDQN